MSPQIVVVVVVACFHDVAVAGRQRDFVCDKIVNLVFEGGSCARLGADGEDVVDDGGCYGVVSWG